MASARGRARDHLIADLVSRWFAEHARPLPWRAPAGLRDPYVSLVSEVMLQQTQVSRVLERFDAFLTRFPDVQTLAAAPEADVLALWSGMGYYRRARGLHAAARTIVVRHGGRVPRDVRDLRQLPGVGRYTAGAIASMVYGDLEPAVDGNVARVLLRVEGREVEQQEGARWAWARAGSLVRTAGAVGVGAGVLNEGLMELGAVVCLPRGTRCDICPLLPVCRAAKRGRQERIPSPKARAARQALYCAAVVLEDHRRRVLVEQRGDRGMWAGLWQVVTLESRVNELEQDELKAALGIEGLARVEDFTHVTTHRDVRFAVWRCPRLSAAQAKRVISYRPGAVWMSREEVAKLGISSAQQRVLGVCARRDEV